MICSIMLYFTTKCTDDNYPFPDYSSAIENVSNWVQKIMTTYNFNYNMLLCKIYIVNFIAIHNYFPSQPSGASYRGHKKLRAFLAEIRTCM